MSAAHVVDDATDVVACWRARAERAEGQVAELSVRVAELSEQVAVLSRMLFGRSSESARSAPAGEDGGEEPGGLSAGESGDPGRPQRGRGQRRGGPGHGRRDYSHLETREEIHDVPADQRVCACCGIAFEPLGAATSEQIDWRVRVTRIVHRRLRYRRRCDCPGTRTVTAPPAANPIPKGLFTSEFLARLLYEKYVLGLPVHRIVRSLAAAGLRVSEGTLCGALKAVAKLLLPLEQAIVERNAQAVHVHADETTWRVFEQAEGKQGHRWWLWVFLAPDTVVFTMDPTRSTAVLDRHFGIDRAEGALPPGRRLVLSTDFYSAYQSLARVQGVDPLWCWAHIRRYFIRAGDAHVQLRSWRDQWVARIADLYLAHRAIAEAEAGSTEHTQARQAFDQALTTMNTVRGEQAAIYSLHPAAKKVLATVDREWDGLVRHRDFPDIPLDNNPAERALRTPVVGRKNYYGSHAEWAAHLAARVWTITATAERNHCEPLEYLTAYLNTCATAGGNAPQGPALNQFLPWIPDPTDNRDHAPGLKTPTGSSP
ncbi:MAG: IS66 family transposase [Pseudonocardiaceae bacterium]